MNRRTARERTLQALFQIDVGKADKDEAYLHVLEEENQEQDEFLKKLLYGTLEHLEEIDQLIENYLEKWSLSRLANVDRNLLRMAVFELKYMDDIPESVTINESVEIAKLYGDDQSSRFINGILSKIKIALEK